MPEKLEDKITYEEIAERLSEVLGHNVDSRRLRLFENPLGSADSPKEIAPGLTGYSGAFNKDGYDATFKITLGERGLEAQRILNGKSKREVVLETLRALVTLHDYNGACCNSDLPLCVGHNCLISMNVI